MGHKLAGHPHLLDHFLARMGVPLHVYNVRTRRKEPFTPLDPAGRKVGLYLCGLTVYDHAHVGHGRTAVAFEVIRRWLERSHDLKFIQNVTDVDDKILARAKELGVSPREHAARWDAVCQAAMARLGVRPPDQAPHVTRNIPQIIAFIQALIAKGMAYATAEGNVYFDVPRYDEAAQRLFPQCAYGTLSNRDFRDLEAGTRKEVEADKLHAPDFALWKAAKPDDHPDGAWDSPWGRGRPGWHIECSVMATEALGDRIDLHGGGQDLLFPHHENEVAQSQAKTGHAPFVNVWLHAGFLNVEGEKMSKSLGNFIVLTDLLDELDAAHGPDRGAEVLRFYLLQTHYRSKIDFTRRGLEEAATALDKLERTATYLEQAASRPGIGCADIDEPLRASNAALATRFVAAMDDDFHTPGAVATLFEHQKACNVALDTQTPTAPLGAAAAQEALDGLRKWAGMLSLLQRPRAEGARGAGKEGTGGLDPLAAVRAAARQVGIELDGARSEGEVLSIVLANRAAARQAKDWKRSDAIRDAMKQQGYLIEDAAGGQRWSRV